MMGPFTNKLLRHLFEQYGRQIDLLSGSIRQDSRKREQGGPGNGHLKFRICQYSNHFLGLTGARLLRQTE